MVSDVVYETLSMPSFVSSMIMKVLSHQIQSKIHFDILKLKPSEFAKTCSVPCKFIIGKQDNLVLPNRVQEIYNAYFGKQKSIINSSGDHSCEREEHIISQCFNYVIQEFKKNAIKSKEIVPQKSSFFDDRFHPDFIDISLSFARDYQKSYNENKHKNVGLYNSQSGKFNFDTYFDESRNEEKLMTFSETEFKENKKNDYPFPNALNPKLAIWNCSIFKVNFYSEILISQ